ncbi:MAG: pyrrolo-quinoline quinone, partial [Planctomycetota bacterium]|nr:pyrrolo-quinoline quinone [Planctomycetota bacterium]
VYLGDQDGDLVVFRAGRKKEVLATMDMESSVYSTAVAANGVLYISTRENLFALAQGANSGPPKN